MIQRNLNSEGTSPRLIPFSGGGVSLCLAWELKRLQQQNSGLVDNSVVQRVGRSHQLNTLRSSLFHLQMIRVVSVHLVLPVRMRRGRQLQRVTPTQSMATDSPHEVLSRTCDLRRPRIQVNQPLHTCPDRTPQARQPLRSHQHPRLKNLLQFLFLRWLALSSPFHDNHLQDRKYQRPKILPVHSYGLQQRRLLHQV